MKPFLHDAVVFNSRLNPKLWGDELMLPEVRDDLLLIMNDFKDFLGVDDLNIVDITVSGSNAAYTYTKHSDIDLHLVVRVPESQDELYTELFDAKKNLYNLTRNIKVRGYDIELYVQNIKNPVESMGIYSVLHDKWLAYPKRVKAQINDISVLSKVNSFTNRIEQALNRSDINFAKKVWTAYRDMRKVGLDREGEFSPENLAFKIIRTRGLSTALFDHIISLKDSELSLEHIEEQKLDELFDRKVDIQIVASSSTWFSTKSTINNRVIQFEADLDPDEDDVWDIAFMEKADAESAGNQYCMSGKGGEFAVMSMVRDSLDMFITKYTPSFFRFTSDTHDGKDSRTKVYKMMSTRYKPANYIFHYDTDEYDLTSFLFTRNDKVQESMIHELFDKQIPMNITSSTTRYFEATAIINDRTIEFGAQYIDDYDGKSIWEMAFSENNEKQVGQFGMTGSGGEFEVIGFIKQCIDVFLSGYSPGVIQFTADKTGQSNSRAQTYTRLVRRYLEPKGYKSRTSNTTARTNFWIEKI